MIQHIADKLINCYKILGGKLSEDMEIEIDYYLRIIIFNTMIILPLIFIGFLTHTLLQIFLLALIINLCYDRSEDNSFHMNTLEKCVLTTVPLMAVSALIAKFTYIHPLLTFLVIIALIKDIKLKNKMLMFILSLISMLSCSVSSALFVGVILTFMTTMSTSGKEVMMKLSDILSKKK